MTNKKKRTKKYDSVKSAQLVNQHILKSMAVTFVARDDKNKPPVSLVNLKGDNLPISRNTASAISDYRYKWFIYLAVGCYNSKGEQEIKVDYVKLTTPYLQSELVEYLNERHQEFIGDLQSKNVKLAFGGWIARASGRELTLKEIDVIFEKQNAWD